MNARDARNASHKARFVRKEQIEKAQRQARMAHGYRCQVNERLRQTLKACVAQGIGIGSENQAAQKA